MDASPPYLPKISICIACYNAEETVERAVCSACGQDWDHIEIIIVDDASTDHSLAILEKLAVDEPRIKLFHNQTNQGIGAVRNSLIKNAGGELIAFFDDDDVSASNRLRKQYERITAYEKALSTDLVLSFTAREQIDSNGSSHYEPTLSMDKTPGVFGNQVAELILTGKPISGERGSMATCSKMARRSVFERVGGYDPNLRRGEDTEFNLRFALLGGHFAGVAAPLVTQHKTYTHDKSFQKERENFFYLLEKHRTYLEDRKLYHFTIGWFEMKFALLEGKKGQFLLQLLKLLLLFPRRFLEKISWSFQNLGQYLRSTGKIRAQAGDKS